MVVAADDGVMPQTREHAAVLAALGVDAGVVAVTKADARRPGARARRRRPSCSRAPRRSPCRPAPARASDALARGARPRRRGRHEPRRAGGAARLHVDRAFTIRGAGTVVTGTLWSGVAARGDAVDAAARRPRGAGARRPGPRRARRPRRRPASASRSTSPASRSTRSRAGTSWSAPPTRPARHRAVRRRGRTPSSRTASTRRSSGPRAAARAGRRRAGARVHHGTREVAARLAELGGRYAQLRLEQPLVPARATGS